MCSTSTGNRSAALAAEREEWCTRRVAAGGLGSGSRCWCHPNTLKPTAVGAGLVGESISELMSRSKS